METIELLEEMDLTAPKEKSAEVSILIILLVIFILALPVVVYVNMKIDPTAGYVDPSILVLILLSIICFMVLTSLCAWLFSKVISIFNLPSVGSMVSQFNELSLCQQLGFYLASFASLLFAAVLCMMAIL